MALDHARGEGAVFPIIVNDLPRWLMIQAFGGGAARTASSLGMQHFLYFTPEPQGHGPFLLGALIMSHGTSAL